jgi:hypothetical protein
MVQAIVALVYGVLLAPWSSGLFCLTASAIGYELATYLFTHGDDQYYDPFARTAVLCCSVFGYLVGRAVSGDDLFQEGVWP